MNLLILYIIYIPLQASRYLSYLVYPLCISGATFSLAYFRQKRWSSVCNISVVLHRLCICHDSSDMFVFFTVTIPGWSTAWWPVSQLSSQQFSMWHLADTDHWWALLPVYTLLLSGVYAFGFLSMAPQLFINHKVCPAAMLVIQTV